MTFFRFLIFSLLIGCFAGSVNADTRRDLKKAQTAMTEQHYDDAFELFNEIEQDSQHPLAQFTLALMFKQGLGRPIDLVMACDWFEKAAKQDVPAAAHEVAECLHNGIGKPADLSQAAQWYKKAGDLGLFMSYCSLGQMYMAGTGVEKNPESAVQYCQMAADKGAPQAILQLGHWYLEGDESIRNPALALKWFTIGAEYKLAEAQFNLGKLILSGELKDTTLLDARYWFETAAAQGYIPAYKPTGELYLTAQSDPESGKPPAEDLAKAYLWLSVAVKRAPDSEQQKAAEQLLNKVLEIIPVTWKPDLDPKIAEHLAKF
ncbi:MAG: tetratricopeptide repeat protein [Methylicorpusculum sp.]|uniref:tetratricopeptide repeat protein n=1 Tax=Methylicorpusculum sp. TaxID=2713644 RepID=UPI00272444BB|nr:tetratricopeptide repeat protein [Methylicorpusculum sp.]MDO8941049.1 tetratricopeptide repeat protein [Methylicorpusculum sp.]MDP2202352.1 tetratricopeptide repeat protein [Methylicorpusculum sp.]